MKIYFQRSHGLKTKGPILMIKFTLLMRDYQEKKSVGLRKPPDVSYASTYTKPIVFSNEE